MRQLDDKPLEAKAINRMVCASTRRTVGIEYLWNNGETSILWIGETYENTRRCRIVTDEPD